MKKKNMKKRPTRTKGQFDSLPRHVQENQWKKRKDLTKGHWTTKRPTKAKRPSLKDQN
jgi:hypothetical protein